MGGLFGKTPKPTAAVRMPDEESPVTRDAEERRRREIAGRSGRDSTKLTTRSAPKANAGSPGTSAYTASLLGSSG